jgi:hypothetical protein
LPLEIRNPQSQNQNKKTLRFLNSVFCVSADPILGSNLAEHIGTGFSQTGANLLSLLGNAEHKVVYRGRPVKVKTEPAEDQVRSAATDRCKAWRTETGRKIVRIIRRNNHVAKDHPAARALTRCTSSGRAGNNYQSSKIKITVVVEITGNHKDAAAA